MDEPFLVKGLRHVFKDFDAAGVVFDEVIVGREDSGDFALGWERGNNYQVFPEGQVAEFLIQLFLSLSSQFAYD